MLTYGRQLCPCPLCTSNCIVDTLNWDMSHALKSPGTMSWPVEKAMPLNAPSFFPLLYSFWFRCFLHLNCLKHGRQQRLHCDTLTCGATWWVAHFHCMYVTYWLSGKSRCEPISLSQEKRHSQVSCNIDIGYFYLTINVHCFNMKFKSSLNSLRVRNVTDLASLTVYLWVNSHFLMVRI